LFGYYRCLASVRKNVSKPLCAKSSNRWFPAAGRNHFLFTHGLAIALLVIAGCQKKYPDEQPVYPISGIVWVDGVPQEGIQVRLHRDEGADQSKPVFPAGFTDNQGNLVISTYANGDGAPAGSYHVTFMWGQINPLSMSYEGPDKLSGRYADPKKSTIVINVSEDAANDLGTVELTAKE